ncbi:hypothetical protein LOAG_04824 [Loa loa]|uniref:Uncharacterized protein n=1 Tax=Loa loa TaxID=7209 RepID=A0A1S0U180_LOALO|nr:hypothetical protein LOAG_04824 [Loa loa]EFO23662.1 hypothetical protein LOAG_04824 [Loa loa]
MLLSVYQFLLVFVDVAGKFYVVKRTSNRRKDLADKNRKLVMDCSGHLPMMGEDWFKRERSGSEDVGFREYGPAKRATGKLHFKLLWYLELHNGMAGHEMLKCGPSACNLCDLGRRERVLTYGAFSGLRKYAF